jgi:hypothetical protein
MASITGATAVVLITLPTVFPAPVQLQGFATDDVYDTDDLVSAETLMGVDGKLSGGFVYVPVVQRYHLQADSPSIPFFDAWYGAQQQIIEVLNANGLISIPSLGKKFTMTKGFLTGYKPLPDAKKLLQPQNFAITWQSVSPTVF